jgi:hypothetical protein
MKTIKNLWDSIIYGFEMAGYMRAHGELLRLGKKKEAANLLEMIRNRKGI